MRVVSAFLANHADVVGGLVYCLGAFPAALELTELPYHGRTWLVVVSELDRSEHGGPLPVAVAVRRTRDDALLLEGSIDVSGTPAVGASCAGDWPLYTTAAVPVVALIEDVGRHRIELRRDGELLWTVGFGIRVAKEDS